MSKIFYKNTHQFSIKKTIEPLCLDEAIVNFYNRQEIQTFFDNALRSQMNLAPIHQIAKDIAPTFCRRHVKSRPQLNSQERMDFLFSELEKGNARVVLKNDYLKHRANLHTPPKSEDGKELLEHLDIKKFVQKQVSHLKNAYSKLVATDFSFLETIYSYDENSIGAVPAVLDLASVKEHSTGWTDWDNPFEYGMLGVAKALLVFDLALATRLSESKFLAAAAGYILEGVKCQYNITGKSIFCRKWYGSYSIRFNLKLWRPELAWVKYNRSGPNERMLFDLMRADRALKDKKVLFSIPPKKLCPLLSGENFLSEYKKGIIPPEHNVMTPMPLNAQN
jgi:hypothetical protein